MDLLVKHAFRDGVTIKGQQLLSLCNGELAAFLKSERGLREDCTLSPYIFVICKNVLSNMIDKSVVERKFGYYPRCKRIQVTHLNFTNHLLEFLDRRRSSIEEFVFQILPFKRGHV